MADQGTEGLLSPWLRSKRIAVARPYLSGRVLDFGCGSGELASVIPPDSYTGVEIDEISLKGAQERFAEHQFVSSLHDLNQRYDTVVSLAVIEHVDDPVGFLVTLAKCLNESSSSSLVITTPHPAIDWVHDIGAKLGLFSSHANEEHHDLLNRSRLVEVGLEAGLVLTEYVPFLLGGNQLAVYRGKD